MSRRLLSVMIGLGLVAAAAGPAQSPVFYTPSPRPYYAPAVYQTPGFGPFLPFR